MHNLVPTKANILSLNTTLTDVTSPHISANDGIHQQADNKIITNQIS